MQRPRSAFTLMELLVVIAILALLIAILIPVMSRGRERGRRAACAGNLYAIGRGCAVYATNFNDYLPMTLTGHAIGYNSLTPYAANQIMNTHLAIDDGIPFNWENTRLSAARRIFFCPSNPSLGDDPRWHETGPFSWTEMRIGYVYMGRRGSDDHLPNPAPGKPFGINHASNLAGTARRVPPLAFHARMHNQPQAGRCDLALDAMVSQVRSAEANARWSQSLSDSRGQTFTVSTPPNSNFTFVYWGWSIGHPGTKENPTGPTTLHETHGSTSHLERFTPAGGNVLSLDGHVEWRKWNPATSFIAGHGGASKFDPGKPYYTGSYPFFWFPEP